MTRRHVWLAILVWIASVAGAGARDEIRIVGSSFVLPVVQRTIAAAAAG